MANTSPKAERPATTQDATSSAKPVHRIQVNDVVISVFADPRGTIRAPIQCRYRGPDGKTGFGQSLRPEQWVDAITALERLIEWHGQQPRPLPGNDA